MVLLSVKRCKRQRPDGRFLPQRVLLCCASGSPLQTQAFPLCRPCRTFPTSSPLPWTLIHRDRDA
ncbi:hypothetical protein ESN35_09385 [Bifidobacterium pullorum subsp. gallinarum]|uniref:Uncharacterized protein n=1 Tax=Bifidobacterium pullorum subsp. gallinarum TaxID=78344 RepID=A0A4P6DXQ7_9BIFI|nr:hypothetical protein ESN35_09385 [Bifidobacterium pullorum subsp. gallinarum]